MKTLRIILAIGALVSFYSCENFDWFKTDSGLKKDISGTWNREFLTNSDFEEDWNFSDGKITIMHLPIPNPNHVAPDTIDQAEYVCDAKMTVSYLKIDGLTRDSTLLQYNNKWTITQLDSKILYIATDYKTGGVLQREFSKK